MDASSPAGCRSPIARSSSSPGGIYEHYHKSQEHLLKPTAANPQPTTVPPPPEQLAGCLGKRHVISFIGLPARGKPFLAERLCHYLAFFHGARCRTFDISKEEYSNDETLFAILTDFLESEDSVATSQVLCAMSEHATPVASRKLSIDDTEGDGSPLSIARSHCSFSDIHTVKKNVDSGRVAILYSSEAIKSHSRAWSGSTKSSRWEMQRQVESLRVKCKILFVETIVTDKELVHSFITQRELGTGSRRRPSADGETLREGEVYEEVRVDRTLTEVELLVQQTEAQIKEYSRKFVTLQDDGSEDELSYMKLINYGQRVITNNARGLLVMRATRFLTSIHPRRHTIYLSRHGQSTYNVMKKIGGNPGLSPEGEKYAQWLGSWVPQNICATPDGRPVPCRLWTSSMRRTIDTARHIPHPMIILDDGSSWEQMANRVHRNLDEIFAGEYEGMTYTEIEKAAEQEARLRKVDKLGYRYPRGESYYDLIARLHVVIHDLEQYPEPLLIISHQATLRVVYAYLKGIPRTQAPELEIPLHTIIRIQYDGFGRLGFTAAEERFAFSEQGENLQNDGQNHL